MRIVSLISSATEILYRLGLGEQVVGVSHECDFPAEVAGKPRLTRSRVDSGATSLAIDQQVRSLTGERQPMYTIDVEQLAALAPDLILTQAQCDVCAVRYADVLAAVQTQPALAMTNILPLNPQRLADVFEDIRRIGRATRSTAVAARVSDSLQRRVRAIADRTARLPASKRRRVACLEWIDPPMLAANWTPELVEMAGGQPGLVTAGAHSRYADWQQIVDYDPEVIVVMPCGFDLPRAILEAKVLPQRPNWKKMTAVRTGRIFAVDGNAYFNRSGPRLVESLEILAHVLHPEKFAAPLPEPQQAWRSI